MKKGDKVRLVDLPLHMRNGDISLVDESYQWHGSRYLRFAGDPKGYDSRLFKKVPQTTDEKIQDLKRQIAELEDSKDDPQDG